MKHEEEVTEKESVRNVQEDYKMKMEVKQEDYKMKMEVKVKNNLDASECESTELFVQYYGGDTDSKQLIKVEKAEVNLNTNVKKMKTEDNKMKNVVNVALSFRQIERLEKMVMFRRKLSVRQIERLEKMAMFRRGHAGI